MKRIRLAPVFAAAVVFLSLSATASLPQNSQALVQELMRKAKAGSNESGFCARARWRVEASYADVGSFYDDAVVGTTKTFEDRFSGPVPYCGLIRIDEITNEGGSRCIRMQMWWCRIKFACHHAVHKGCRDEKGSYAWSTP